MSEFEQDRLEVIDFMAPYVGAGTPDFGVPTDADMERINQLAKKPLERSQVFVAPARISRDDMVDSYFTIMHESTLRNYAMEAAAGVPFMNSHRTNPRGTIELPVGRSIAGEVRSTADGAGLEAISRAYIVRGQYPNGRSGLSTDDLIAGIECGTNADVSVGFNLGLDGYYECRICGNDPNDISWLWSWDEDLDMSRYCTHIPGCTYVVDGVERVADAWVKQAHLSEFSAVFRGATPTASFLKAERMLERQLLSRSQVAEFEHRHNRSLRPAYAVRDLSQTGPPSPKPRMKEPAMPSFARDLLARFNIATQSDEVSLDEAVRMLTDHQKQQADAAVAELAARVASIEPKARMADELLSDLIDDCIAWGVRADGDRFAAETQRQILTKAGDVALIRAARESYRLRAEASFGPSQRTTTPVQPPAQPDMSRRDDDFLSVPYSTAAYRS